MKENPVPETELCSLITEWCICKNGKDLCPFDAGLAVFER
jgi:hypothetical protein